MHRVFAILGGSGGAAFSERCTAARTVQLALQARAARWRRANDERSVTAVPLVVCYVGTATYDQADARAKQTDRFRELGCAVVSVDVAWPQQQQQHQFPSAAAWMAACRATMLASDVILISGGNSLYAIRRWRMLGLDRILIECAHEQICLAGGSFGLLAWFTAAHSDSGDPETFRPRAPDGAKEVEAADAVKPAEGAKAAWRYMSTSGLGLFAGFACPHQDRVQSNGVPRFVTLDEMLLKAANEVTEPGDAKPPFSVLAVDHWACVVLNGDDLTYEVFAVDGKEGSLVLLPHEPGGDAKTAAGCVAQHKPGAGVPGVWLKTVSKDRRTVEYAAVPRTGRAEDILVPSAMGADVAEEERILKLNPLPVDAW